MSDPQSFDRDVRVQLYDAIIDDGRVPTVADLAARLGRPANELHASVRRLAEARVLVPHPGGNEILMANPFSAVPTAFPVASGERRWWGNCIWDALGIAAILGADATVDARCGDCDERLPIVVRAGAVQGDGVVHFAVPARKWWENIVFT